MAATTITMNQHEPMRDKKHLQRDVHAHGSQGALLLRVAQRRHRPVVPRVVSDRRSDGSCVSEARENIKQNEYILCLALVYLSLS